MRGVCRECLLAEILVEEHPEMKAGDIFELVQGGRGWRPEGIR